MNEFDTSLCCHCKRPQSEHKTRGKGLDDLFLRDCPEGGGKYWPYAKELTHTVARRSEFVRKMLESAVRGGIGITEQSPAYYAKIWEALEADEDQFMREWRPK